MGILDDFTLYRQQDSKDCGPASLRMIAKYYGKNYTLQTLREYCFITREGVSMLGISDAAERIGFRTTALKISVEQLVEDVPLPCILHWNHNHFVVCYKIKKGRNGNSIFYIADPAYAVCRKYNGEDFKDFWVTSKKSSICCGTALVLEPRQDFYSIDDETEYTKKCRNLGYFFRYMIPYKWNFILLGFGIMTISMLQMISPLLSQSMVDMGILSGNIGLITMVLVAQLVVFMSRLSINFSSRWITTHTNTRIQISLVSDFLMKLMKMPLRYFDTKMTGDIMQRIGDQRRINSFMTGIAVDTLFSVVNFFVYTFLLLYYSTTVFFVFFIGNIFHFLWIVFFLRFRRDLDYKRFNQSAKAQSNLIQLVQGMAEIKLNNCEKQKRWEWEGIQVNLFNINLRGLALGQAQELGSTFFTQTTSLLISFIAAKSVVDNNMTLGMMMALTYIVGQISAPVNSFIILIQSFQDAKISLERLNEVFMKEDEDSVSCHNYIESPCSGSIKFSNVNFSYSGADRDYVLKDINLEIEEHKVTAIVGASGSGKTTLIKMMQGFYAPNTGDICVGNMSLDKINPHMWRSCIGSVMQDGFIFSDSIANNIAVGVDEIDKDRLLNAVQIANIQDFIESLPLGYSTKIGMDGCGISQGQKQRILIARAIYKNPQYIFLDEATNSLDSSNESQVMENLYSFYTGKTVVVAAHRLCTVKDADKIIVLDCGRVVEVGTHESLIELHGKYYSLVKNQMFLEQR